MSEPKPEPTNRKTPEKPHWRLYAAVVAVLAAVVAVTNGVNVISKFPASVAELRQWLWPAPEESPISLTIAADATRPPPGFSIVKVADLGDVFGGGADVRLVVQASSADRIAQIVRLRAKVKRIEVPTQVAFKADPLAQPGFGAARPETFLVGVTSETSGTVSYVSDQQTTTEAPFPELLPSDLVLNFGGADGAQDTIDLKMRLKSPGIYEVRFAATVMSNKKEYVVETAPLRMGRE